MTDLSPFVKISWNGEDNRKKYSQLFSEIGRLADKVEYDMVKFGYRMANTYYIDPLYFDMQMEKIERDGLVFLPIQRVKRYQGFAHSFTLKNTIDRDTLVFGVIARDIKTAEKFRRAYNERDDIMIGKMLGYPSCDIDFFVRNWSKNLDLVYETAENTDNVRIMDDGIHVKGYPQLNRILRYFGVRIIPWFPCSYTCDSANRVAKKWVKLFKRINDELTDKAIEFLSEPMKWSLVNGIIEVRTKYFIGIVNGYLTNRYKVVIWEGGI